MSKRKLSKEDMSRVLARDLLSITKKSGPTMYRFIPTHARKIEEAKPTTASTSNGRVSKVDILSIREQILASWGRI